MCSSWPTVWDTHTEQDIENVLVDGHAVVTTMEVTPDLQHYTSGVYYSPECQNWRLGPDRDYQWEEEHGLRRLRHAVIIVGFGVDADTDLSYWKVKNSWGELWGESGFLKIARGYGLCGLGAYISVPLCGAYSGQSLPFTNTSPPPNLQQESVFFGQDRTLSSPLAQQGLLGCSAEKCRDSCKSTRPCRTFCGPVCQRRGGQEGTICCRPLGGRGLRLYCPSRGTQC